MSEPAGAGVLERARIHAALTTYGLWLRYFAIGGSADPARFEGYLSGLSEPDKRQYNLIVDSLNERFTELHLDHPVRYAA